MPRTEAEILVSDSVEQPAEEEGLPFGPPLVQVQYIHLVTWEAIIIRLTVFVQCGNGALASRLGTMVLRSDTGSLPGKESLGERWMGSEERRSGGIATLTT